MFELFCILTSFFLSILIMVFKRSFVFFLIGVELAFNFLLLLFLFSLSAGFDINFFIYILALVAAETAIGLGILLNITKEKGEENYDLF